MLNIKLKLTKLKVKSVDGLYEWKDIGGDISGNTTLQAALDKKMDKDEIPSLEGYATEEWVTKQGYLTEHQDLSTYAKKADIPSLEGYATEQWVTSKNYLTSHQSLEDYATKEQLSTKANKEHTHLLKDITDYVAPNLSIYAKKTDIPSLNGYATEEWVTSKKYLTSHQSLEDYYTKTEVDTKLKAISGGTVDLSEYYTKVESDDKYALKTSIPTLNGYATEQWVENKGYLTSHQSLTDYAKKAELTNYYTKVESDDKYALSSDIPSLNGYATEQWVTDKGYLTTHQSLEDYAKKTDLSTKADKEHTHLLKDITDYVAPNLSIYAKKTDIPSLNGYATEQWVTDKGYLTTHQSLTDYAKKAELKTINGSSLIGSGDIQIEGGGDGINKWEGTRAEYNALSAYDENTLYVITDEDVEYATEQWVTDKGYLTTHQSLEDYAKKTDLSTKADKEHTHLLKDITDYVAPNLSIYAKKTDIPSLEGYATEQWVTNKGYLTSHQSLTDYAKKSELKTINGSSLIGSGDIQIEGGGNGVQKWEGTRAEYNALSAYDENTLYVITDEDVEYATQQWVTDQGYLTSHQDLSTYAKKAEVEAKQDKLTNTETLTFLMEDGTSVEKTIYLK